MGTRVLVCGGREYTDTARISQVLDRLPVALLIHGDCRGTDRLAAQWATAHAIPVKPYPADWDNLDAPRARIRLNPRTGRFYNANAGFQRNQDMLSDGRPDLVVAFPGNAGTADMIARALKAGVAVLTVEE